MKKDLGNKQADVNAAFGDINTGSAFKGNNQRNAFAENILNKKLSIFERILPNEVTQDIENHQRILISQYGKQTREVQRIIGEYEVNAIKTALNSVLLKGKGCVEKDASLTFVEYKVEFANEIDRLQTDFNKILLRKYEQIDNMPISAIKEKMMAEAALESESYYTMVATFIARFQDLTESLVN